jgi:hypothetical protein
MTGEFLNIAGALTGEESAELARALLREIEGRDAPPETEAGKEESVPASADLAAAAEILAKAAEAMVLRAETGPPSSGAAAAENTEAASAAARPGREKTKLFTAGRTVSGPPGPGGDPGSFRYAGKEGGAGSPDPEALSESIRRDARRCDPGFERY